MLGHGDTKEFVMAIRLAKVPQIVDGPLLFLPSQTPGYPDTNTWPIHHALYSVFNFEIS